MLIKSLAIFIHSVRTTSLNFRSRIGWFTFQEGIFPQILLEPAIDGIQSDKTHNKSNNGDLISLLNEYILKAVPKSKVTPSRKRMGHTRYIPEVVNWHVCQRCGEPRKPHRICKDHMDICAMREEDWLAKKKSEEAAKSPSTPN